MAKCLEHTFDSRKMSCTLLEVEASISKPRWLPWTTPLKGAAGTGAFTRFRTYGWYFRAFWIIRLVSWNILQVVPPNALKYTTSAAIVDVSNAHFYLRNTLLPRLPRPVGEREALDAAEQGEAARDVDAAHAEVAHGQAAQPGAGLVEVPSPGEAGARRAGLRGSDLQD